MRQLVLMPFNIYAAWFVKLTERFCKKLYYSPKFTEPDNSIMLLFPQQRENGLSPSGGDFKKPWMPQGEL